MNMLMNIYIYISLHKTQQLLYHIHFLTDLLNTLDPFTLQNFICIINLDHFLCHFHCIAIHLDAEFILAQISIFSCHFRIVLEFSQKLIWLHYSILFIIFLIIFEYLSLFYIFVTLIIILLLRKMNQDV